MRAHPRTSARWESLGSVRLTRPGVWSKVRDRLGWRRSRPVTESTTDVLLSGVVYLAVAVPADELSNWSQLITSSFSSRLS